MANSSGYPTNLFLNPPQDCFLCPICLDVMKNPYQCPEGHTFCHTDIVAAILAQGKCPMCKMDLAESQLGKNLFVRNQISVLEMRCPHSESPETCTWTGQVGDLETHLKSCSFHEIEEVYSSTASPAAATAHNFVRNRCKICTSCGVCTGYGANCCECRGRNRSGDKGKDCGCGHGDSGCSSCGMCVTCARSKSCSRDMRRPLCQHTFTSSRCRICTTCAACTGYGRNCVRCRGLNRSSDMGRDCGCGAGDSGCSQCGICRNCALSSSHEATTTPSGSVAHCGSWEGCGGNPNGISNCRGSGNCGRGCVSCGARTHWTCCGSTDQRSSNCPSHVNRATAIRNKDIMFGEHPSPVHIREIPGVDYGGSGHTAAPAGGSGRHAHPGSFTACGGNPMGISNCKGGGTCGDYCNSCGAHTHWTCCGSTDIGSTQCPSHVTQAQAYLNSRVVIEEHAIPLQVCKIPGVQYGCPHPGSFPGCGGNRVGISNCRGGGNCGSGCSNCGARTHWSCCGSTDSSSTHCPPHIPLGRAKKNTALVFNAHPTPIPIRSIPGVDYGNGVPHNYVTGRCRICTQCAVCTGYGARCCKCRGVDRSGNRGQDCGCGGGASGCSNCGKCEACGGTEYTCSGSMEVHFTSPVHSTTSSASLLPPPGMSLPAPTPAEQELMEEWYYIDGLDVVQGPFTTEMMRQWYDGGYLENDLKIKLNEWTTFHALGDLYPAGQEGACAFTYRVLEPRHNE